MKAIKIQIEVETTVKIQPEWLPEIEAFVREQYEMSPSDPISTEDIVMAAIVLDMIPEPEGRWTTVEADEYTVEDFTRLKKEIDYESRRQTKSI